MHSSSQCRLLGGTSSLTKRSDLTSAITRLLIKQGILKGAATSYEGRPDTVPQGEARATIVKRADCQYRDSGYAVMGLQAHSFCKESWRSRHLDAAIYGKVFKECLNREPRIRAARRATFGACRAVGEGLDAGYMSRPREPSTTTPVPGASLSWAVWAEAACSCGIMYLAAVGMARLPLLCTKALSCVACRRRVLQRCGLTSLKTMTRAASSQRKAWLRKQKRNPMWSRYLGEAPTSIYIWSRSIAACGGKRKMAHCSLETLFGPRGLLVFLPIFFLFCQNENIR